MPPLKFAANISWLFKENGDLVNRYKAAKLAGFLAVESAFPYEQDIESLVEEKNSTNMRHVLVNAYQGDPAKKEVGIAALPTHKDVFKSTLQESVRIAKLLGCGRMHVMAGKVPNDSTSSMKQAMEETYLENIKYAADCLQKENIMLLIEPINNKYSVPNYFLNDVHQAVKYIRHLNHSNIKLQADIFHWQILHGDITGLLKEYMPLIGHIQIAQVPGRGEPSSLGEINFDYIFDLLGRLSYSGYIGCEYIPTDSQTLNTLGWLQKLV